MFWSQIIYKIGKWYKMTVRHKYFHLVNVILKWIENAFPLCFIAWNTIVSIFFNSRQLIATHFLRIPLFSDSDKYSVNLELLLKLKEACSKEELFWEKAIKTTSLLFWRFFEAYKRLIPFWETAIKTTSLSYRNLLEE